MSRKPFLVAALALAACDAGPAIESVDEAIVNGTPDPGADTAVVYYKLLDAQGTYLAHCTATLITPRIALTAAHCANGNEGDSKYQILFIDSYNDFTDAVTGALDTKPRNSVKTWVDPKYDPSQAAIVKGHDMALVLFDGGPPAGVKPVPFTRTRIAQTMKDKKDRFVGYGIRENPTTSPFYDKRTASTFITYVQTQIVGWTLGLAFTCNGDSGGPHFVQTPTGEEIFAVTSFGSSDDCMSNSYAQRVDANTDAVVQFIDDNDPQPTQNCGADGICGWNCPDIDPDCPCVRDGKCTPACTNPDLDPDCPLYCGKDDVCVRTGCPVPDPDCGDKALGDTCTNKNECVSGLCTASGATSYCSQACGAANACPSGFSCAAASSQCLPEAKGSGGGGCAVGGDGGAAIGALALALGALRRRRRA